MFSRCLLLLVTLASAQAMHAVYAPAASQCARTAGIHCSGQRLRKRDRVAQLWRGLRRNKEEPPEARPSSGGMGLTLAERYPVPVCTTRPPPQPPPPDMVGPPLELLKPPVDVSEQSAIEMAKRVAALKAQGTATVLRRSAMAKACAEKLAAPRGAAEEVVAEEVVVEEVVAHDSVAQDKQLDSSMTAAVQELTALLGSNPGWKQLADFYGGRSEGCLAAHLRETAVRDGQGDVAAAHARILKTLEYRANNTLDRPDVLRSIETARCRSFWPFAFAEKALDGSPVEICRLSRLSVPRILTTFPEEEVVHFYGLWCEQTLRLYGESALAGAPTQGALHVYDCREVSAHASHTARACQS